MNKNSLYDFFTGPCVRRIKTDEKTIYLTFDDGPHPESTPKVLEILNKYDIKATFFQIANNAKENIELCKKMIRSGHSIGNHSIDHDTNNYFKNKNHIKRWIESSSSLFNEEVNIQPIGFRSPLGIKTPALNNALKELGTPLILWDIRFYDTKYALTQNKIDHAVKTLKPGSIILLHDVQGKKFAQDFYKYLELFIKKSLDCEYKFAPLTKELINKSL